MASRIQNEYIPDLVSPPGETLIDKLEELGMSQAELARRTGRPRKTINEIAQGKTAITPRTALQLERVLGISASFWNNRERQYQEYLAKKEEEVRLADEVEWLQEFPIRDMIEKDWIRGCNDEISQLDELLGFFGVASPAQWRSMWSRLSTAFRKTQAFASDPKAVSAWLRRGEIEAQEIRCRPYNEDVFLELLETEIRSLTTQPPDVFQYALVDLCAQVGVAVTFVPQISGARVSGATRWLTSNKALIQLSLRYKTDDQLWFTFFHEAGHILLHGKRDIFLEEGKDTDGAKEDEADRFAADTLIPPEELESFLSKPLSVYRSIQGIKAFASEIGIAPGIVVGRLQHDEYLPYTHCNALKQTLSWAT